MSGRHEPGIEVFIVPPTTDLDLSIGLDVTMASIRAACRAGFKLSTTLTFDLPTLDVSLPVLKTDSRLADVAAAGILALGAYATQPFYIVMELGQAFPWRTPVKSLIRGGKAILYAEDCGADSELRAAAVLVSGIAAPSVVVPRESPAVYSADLSERAEVMLRAMHGEAWRNFPGIFKREDVLYALINDDRIHTRHVVEHTQPSPLSSIVSMASGMGPDGLYARLRGL